jgi:hypothetical protein
MTKAPHLQGPRRDFTDPSGDLLAEGQYRPSGGEDQNAGRTICGEVLQARAPCRLLEPGDPPGCSPRRSSTIATCAHLTLP